MSDIERKIRERSYQSPARARGVIARSGLGRKEAARLDALITEWENEGTVEHVVAGLPPAAAEVHVAEVVDLNGTGGGKAGPDARGHALARLPFVRLNLNARVLARLTPAGVAALYAARDRILVPPSLLEDQGVWETTLWEFMVVMGPAFVHGGDVLTALGELDILDPRSVT